MRGTFGNEPLLLFLFLELAYAMDFPEKHKE